MGPGHLPLLAKTFPSSFLHRRVNQSQIRNALLSWAGQENPMGHMTDSCPTITWDHTLQREMGVNLEMCPRTFPPCSDQRRCPSLQRSASSCQTPSGAAESAHRTAHSRRAPAGIQACQPWQAAEGCYGYGGLGSKQQLRDI